MPGTMNPTQMCIFAGMLQLVPGTPSIEPPRVNPFSFLKRWRAGEKTTVICTVASGTAPMKFIWMKDGKELKETSSVRFKHEQGYSMLFIEPVEVNSGGNYTCVVKNRAGIDSYTTFLDVEASPRWAQTPGDQKMAFGSEVKLNCRATGSPPPAVRWEMFVEATQAWTKLRAEGERLDIPRVTNNETGRYRCTAVNGVQPDIRHDFLLSIYGEQSKRTQKYTDARLPMTPGLV